jgi:hypothetical protein
MIKNPVEAITAIAEAIIADFLSNRIGDIYQTHILVGIGITIVIAFLLFHLLTPVPLPAIEGEAPPPSSFRRHLRAVLFAVGYGLLYLTLIYLCETRWAVSKGAGVALVAMFFCFSLLLWPLFGRYRIRHSRVEGCLDILPICILALLVYLADSLLPRYISIDRPPDINGPVKLSGIVTDPKWTVFLMVKPMTSDGTLEKALRADGDKRWMAIHDFGGGPGSQFLVRAIALEPATAEIVGPNPSYNRIEQIVSFSSGSLILSK